MILPDFYLKSRAGLQLKYTGIDDPNCCADKQHFDNYPHSISYQYNSRGFRDQEWPNSIEELKNSVWCIGDSFTVGVGSPIEHTWPSVLRQSLNQQIINVSLDGASNKWIYRKAQQVLDTVMPELMILHWSYITRDEIDNDSLSDEDRRMHFKRDDLLTLEDKDYLAMLKNLIDLLEQNKKSTTLVHSFIPKFGLDFDAVKIWGDVSGPNWPNCPVSKQQFDCLPAWIKQELQEFNLYQRYAEYFDFFNGLDFIPEFKQLDLARDGHHYDLLTAEFFVCSVRKLLSNGTI
jgi:hypothetical protein